MKELLNHIRSHRGSSIVEALFSAFLVSMSAYAVIAASEGEKKSLTAFQKKYLAQAIAEDVAVSYAAFGKTKLKKLLNDYENVCCFNVLDATTGADFTGPGFHGLVSGPGGSPQLNWINPLINQNPFLTGGIGDVPVHTYVYYKSPDSTTFETDTPGSLNDYEVYIRTIVTYERFENVPEMTEWLVVLPADPTY